MQQRSAVRGALVQELTRLLWWRSLLRLTDRQPLTLPPCVKKKKKEKRTHQVAPRQVQRVLKVDDVFAGERLVCRGREGGNAMEGIESAGVGAAVSSWAGERAGQQVAHVRGLF